MKQLNQELAQAIAECRQDNLTKRRTSLNRLLILIQQLPGIYTVSHQDYPEAYNRTLMWVCQNIDRFEPTRESVEKSLVIWINGYLKWRIRDLYISDNSYDPQRVYPTKNNEELDLIANLPDPQVSLSLLDSQIAQMQAEKSENMGKAIVDHIKQDQDKKLTTTFIRQHPQCNCHNLALRLLLEQPPQKISQIARELEVNNQTLYSHWKQKCLPLLQSISQSINHESTN
ncbi:MAG: hypothetical protein AAFQ14_12070 [Cyanobacteria bacterium J06621_12]